MPQLHSIQGFALRSIQFPLKKKCSNNKCSESKTTSTKENYSSLCSHSVFYSVSTPILTETNLSDINADINSDINSDINADTNADINADKFPFFLLRKCDYKLLYVSEIFSCIDDNATFAPVYLNSPQIPFEIRHSHILRFKAYSKCLKCLQWSILIDNLINLQHLDYISTSLNQVHSAWPPNSIIILLKNAVFLPILPFTLSSFSNFNDLSSNSYLPIRYPPVTKISIGELRRISKSSSFKDLLEINTLSHAIQDAFSTAVSTKLQFSLFSQKNLNLMSKLQFIKHRLQKTNSMIQLQSNLLSNSKKKLLNLKKFLIIRNKLASNSNSFNDYFTVSLSTISTSKLKWQISEIDSDILKERQRIAKILLSIFPFTDSPDHPIAKSARIIKPTSTISSHPNINNNINNSKLVTLVLPESPLSIANLCLPSSLLLPSHRELIDIKTGEVVGAALGYVAQILHLLQFYMLTALRYIPKPFGSRSTIYDPISILSGPRIFPLYSHDTMYYRFEYAVFLLNNDIQQLLAHINIYLRNSQRIHMLPNLYTLLKLIAGQPPPSSTQPYLHPMITSTDNLHSNENIHSITSINELSANSNLLVPINIDPNSQRYHHHRRYRYQYPYSYKYNKGFDSVAKSIQNDIIIPCSEVNTPINIYSQSPAQSLHINPDSNNFAENAGQENQIVNKSSNMDTDTDTDGNASIKNHSKTIKSLKSYESSFSFNVGT